jgi:hypothetical protein
VRSSDSEAAARSSPGRGRPELGDDQWVPLVSDNSEGGSGAGWRGLVGQLGHERHKAGGPRARKRAGGLAGLRAGARGLLGYGARRVKRLGRLAQVGCCASLLLGWARR